VDEHDRESIYAFCSMETLAAGEVLLDYDEPGKALYFIKAGRLAVNKFTGFQKKMQVVALLGQGSVVGESALLEKQCHKTKVTAIEDSELLCLSSKKYKILQNELPDLAFCLLEYLLSITRLRLEKTSERLAQIL
jgi:CRP/FNR family transcriptional regulator, cyclic AMP receptor protein